MIEKQSINGREVWLKVDAHPMQRENPNIIPREYFTATYYTEDPNGGPIHGEVVTDETGEPKLFESPVAALSFARNRMEGGSDRQR
jgi:hypothetical protein